MRIWLLENGERTGPHEMYTIRDRISGEEIQADTLAWYEGADGWVALEEVPAYASYFKGPQEVRTLGEDGKITPAFIESLEKELSSHSGRSAQAGADSGSFENEPLHPVRRLFARLLDVFIYSMILFIVKVQVGINPFLIESISRELMFQLPYLVLDGLALAYFGATPGKWLLNIHLRSHDGRFIDITTSLIRSARVWVLGLAMMSWLILISLPISWFIGSKYGKFLWDIPQNNITRCDPLTPLKMVLILGVFMGMGLLMQYFIPAEMIPTVEEWKSLNGL